MGMLASLNATLEWKDLNPGGIISESRGREQRYSSGKGAIVKGEIKGESNYLRGVEGLLRGFSHNRSSKLGGETFTKILERACNPKGRVQL